MATRPRPSLTQALLDLERLSEAARREIDDDRLWPFSMPPRLPAEAAIPIADFGSGETGRQARLYREGLALRYGKARQMICGVHVNVSLGPSLLALAAALAPLADRERGGERTTDAFYLRLARNLYRDLPLLVLLLGAAPVLGGDASATAALAVSYRNSRLGYGRDEFLPYLDLESLDAYAAGIRRGQRTRSERFLGLGLVRDGQVVQLNTSVFQTEKEFYAPIRLRQTLRAGESTLQALARGGIGYLELRFVDVDPFHRAGVADDTLRLLHLLVLDGLVRPSPERTNAGLRNDVETAMEVALLDPFSLESATDGLARQVLAAAARRLAELEIWARKLDWGPRSRPYGDGLLRLRRRVAEGGRLPSARLARAFLGSGLDWTSFGARLAARQGRRQLRQGAERALADARL